MKLTSTRDSSESVDFSQAILSPSASGGGLYAPLSLPKFNGYEFKDLNYQEFALKLIQSFKFGLDELFERALKSYSYEFDDEQCPIKLTQINGKLFINELYHGPTRAFKDMALQPFGMLLYYLKPEQRLLIMCATSGDTGPATLASFANEHIGEPCCDCCHVRGRYIEDEMIRVVCLYPATGTSRFQALQMTSLNALNIKVFAIKGNFDDAQKALKNLLADDEFKQALQTYQTELSAANSVNFGRILFQIIYHYFALIKFGKNADIIVPSGNFGDALGAYYAKKMGAKIDRIKIASNANNILTDFFTKGEYDLRGRVLKKTISPAMDILISSNIERLIFDKFGDKRTKELFSQLKEEQFFKLEANELESLKEDFDADFCTDDECKTYIKDFAKTALIDPHTATCFKLLDKNKTTIITSTAEWTKFTPSMFEALFNKACENEKEAMLTIAKEYNYVLKPEIPALFDKAQDKVRVYEVSELKDEILKWIKETQYFTEPDFKGFT